MVPAVHWPRCAGRRRRRPGAQRSWIWCRSCRRRARLASSPGCPTVARGRCSPGRRGRRSRSPPRRHIPIIFLTAVDYDAHLVFRGYEAGAVDYITKPLDPWVIRSKVGVFADLWTVHAELSAQAQQCQSLCSAIGDAVQALEKPRPDTERAATCLRAALARVAEAAEQAP